MFFEISYQLESIDGCSLASDGTSLAVQGLSVKQNPVLIDLDTATGSVNKFINIEYEYDLSSEPPSYDLYGAVYYDKTDYRDGLPNWFASFVKDGQMYSMKISDDEEVGILTDWNLEFRTFDTIDSNEPRFLQPADNINEMLLIGRQYGKGSVFKFNKARG